jgi:hypothetical protein
MPMTKLSDMDTKGKKLPELSEVFDLINYKHNSSIRLLYMFYHQHRTGILYQYRGECVVKWFKGS